MENRVVYDYTPAWKYDRTMYALGDYPLLVPLTMNTLGITALVEIIFFLFAKVVPPIDDAWIVYYLVIPYFLAREILKMNPEGKNLFRLVRGYVRYIFMNKHLNRYHSIERNKKYRFSEPISYRKRGD